ARFPLGTILTAAAVAGPLMGIVALQFYSVLLGWTGRLFGGAAPFRQIRTTVAWAEAPIVATLGLLIPATLVLRRALFALGAAAPVVALPLRSEEHTSELQSQSNLVCRLLLEKKNNSRHRDLPNLLRMFNRREVMLPTLRHPSFENSRLSHDYFFFCSNNRNRLDVYLASLFLP